MKTSSIQHFSGIDILRCLESLCYGAIDLFAMISGYLLVFSKWKLSRYFILYVQVAFYTILFAFIAKFLTENFYQPKTVCKQS